MWELYHKESWVPKTWCFWTMVLEKTLESPLDCKEIKLVNLKGNESWIFIGRTDAVAEAPVLRPTDAKNWLLRKDRDAGKDWKQKGTTEDEMVGWHHGLYGHEFEQALGVGDGQGSLLCCSPTKSRTRLSNWTDWCECGETKTLTHYCWEWKMENSSVVLQRTNWELPYDPVILLSNTYLKD